MNDAFVFLGSNIARDRNYLAALQELAALGRVIGVSSVYDTAPLGGAGDAPRFYNGTVRLETSLAPRALKGALREIEARLGRLRSEDPNAPRPIDLDLVLYNKDGFQDSELQIPDPNIRTRPFMTRALAELAPDYLLPPVGPTLAEWAKRGADDDTRIDYGMTARVQRWLTDLEESEKHNASFDSPARG